MKNIFKSLLTAHKPEQVREVIMKIGKINYRFEPVGNRKNNLATINIGTDPAAGVTERITNAIDAVLEKEWVEKNQQTLNHQGEQVNCGLILNMVKSQRFLI